MAEMKRNGYGQVEPNHLSAQRTAQIYAQLPADTSINVLENGQYVKYNYAANKVDFVGEGEWMLVFNEVKLYDGYRETYKDFAMKKSNYTEGVMTPRVFKTNIGDIYTTNCLKKAASNNNAEVTMEDLSVSDKLVVNAQGYLEKSIDVSKAPMVWQVVKKYTLADGQEAVKIMRIK